jgi:uncharacterized repeat protein (TIGR02543 family)
MRKLFLLLIIPTLLFATQHLWNPSTTSFKAAGNWDGGYPADGDTAIADGTHVGAMDIDTSIIKFIKIFRVGYSGAITQSVAICTVATTYDSIGTSGAITHSKKRVYSLAGTFVFGTTGTLTGTAGDFNFLDNATFTPKSAPTQFDTLIDAYPGKVFTNTGTTVFGWLPQGGTHTVNSGNFTYKPYLGTTWDQNATTINGTGSYIIYLSFASGRFTFNGLSFTSSGTSNAINFQSMSGIDTCFQAGKLAIAGYTSSRFFAINKGSSATANAVYMSQGYVDSLGRGFGLTIGNRNATGTMTYNMSNSPIYCGWAFDDTTYNAGASVWNHTGPALIHGNFLLGTNTTFNVQGSKYTIDTASVLLTRSKYLDTVIINNAAHTRDTSADSIYCNYFDIVNGKFKGASSVGMHVTKTLSITTSDSVFLRLASHWLRCDSALVLTCPSVIAKRPTDSMSVAFGGTAGKFKQDSAWVMKQLKIPNADFKLTCDFSAGAIDSLKGQPSGQLSGTPGHLDSIIGLKIALFAGSIRDSNLYIQNCSCMVGEDTIFGTAINGGGNYGFIFGNSTTYTITYNGNASTGGTVPVDAGTYITGATVTVLGNTGSLVKTGYTFNNWNTAENGSGASYAPATTFAMGSDNVTLYAQWSQITYTLTMASSGSHSTTTPTVGAHTQNYGDAIPLLSTPDVGCRHILWRVTVGTAHFNPDSTIDTIFSTHTLTDSCRFIQYLLTVQNGTGSGTYDTATSVTIGMTPPASSDSEAYQWTVVSGASTVTNSTHLLLKSNTVLRADYRIKAPDIYGFSQVCSTGVYFTFADTNKGGPGIWRSITTLPSGLSRDGLTGIVSGTPTTVISRSGYKMQDSNSTTIDTAFDTIQVFLGKPIISYPPTITWSKFKPITQITPTSTGGLVASWAIKHALPDTLAFSTSTGVISGSAGDTAHFTDTVIATNASGSDTSVINFIINNGESKKRIKSGSLGLSLFGFFIGKRD